MLIIVALTLPQSSPWKGERLDRACMLPLRAETYAPVTVRRIWTDGKDVTDKIRPHQEQILRLLASGKKGKFKEDFVRLGIATKSGYTMYVDMSGGVRMSRGDSHLNARQFAALEKLLPNFHHGQTGRNRPPDFTLPPSK